MFAPEAPKEDFTVIVDAVTKDGRHVDPLIEWVEGYPLRTGRTQDTLASCDSIHIKDESPAPGQTEPRNVQVRKVFSHEF